VSFILGFLASAIAGLLLSYLQFSFSTAGYRVKMTVQATRKIVKARAENAYTETLRDKYRYSLGVIIDELAATFGTTDDFQENEPWPRLVNSSIHLGDDPQTEKKDRWSLFDQCIRPVIQDINIYSFIGWFRLCPTICQLSALVRLCNRLETVVGELDAAFGGGLVGLDTKDKVVRQPTTDPAKVQSLKKKYCDLHKAWLVWLRAAHI
jgi:hypothetical protein